MHEAAPVIVIGQHRNRKSVPHCDAIQKNPDRCKKLTGSAPRTSEVALMYQRAPPSAPPPISSSKSASRHSEQAQSVVGCAIEAKLSISNRIVAGRAWAVAIPRW